MGSNQTCHLATDRHIQTHEQRPRTSHASANFFHHIVYENENENILEVENPDMSGRRRKTHKWGITPPLSVCLPTDDERAQTRQMQQFLKNKAGVYESRDEMALRRQILQDIYDVACQWVWSKTGARNKCCLFTFGSYRLGVGGPGADIDALVVTPQSISREQFFDDWEKILLDRKEHVSKAVLVRESFVPVIKFVWRDVDIDLLFCALDESAIVHNLNPASDDDRVLECVQDETSVRSLNGVRVTDRILQLVPSVSTFRTVLRFVKHWAKQRGIYSNSIGYLGGVAWAILVARVCQLYPLSSAFTVLKHFYTIMSRWQWPNPVMLSPPSRASETLNNGAALSMPQWDSTSNYRDRQHLMPILTPAFPSQNCTYNVSQSTFATIKSELNRADVAMARFSMESTVADRFSSTDSETDGARKIRKLDHAAALRVSIDEFLGALSAPTTFFADFKTFLCVEAFVDRPIGRASLAPSPSKAQKETSLRKTDEPRNSFQEVLLADACTGAAHTSLSSRLYDIDEFMISGSDAIEQDSLHSLQSTQGTALCDAAAQAAANRKPELRETAVEPMSDYERDAWFGWVESRLRFLTAGLEQTLHIDRVCPFPRAYKSADREPDDESCERTTCCYFFGLKFSPKTLVVGEKTKVDLRGAINQFLNRIYAQQTSILAGCTVQHIKRKELPDWVRQR